jgi:hypothetical protein
MTHKNKNSIETFMGDALMIYLNLKFNFDDRLTYYLFLQISVYPSTP